MPLPSILKKATNYILGENAQDNKKNLYQDGEALFCKNNVCVHPPNLMRQHCDVVHHPGYLTITCRFDNRTTTVPTLHLSWIPNSTLRKQPTALENLANKSPLSSNTNSSNRRKITEDIEGEEERQDERINIEQLDMCLEAKEPIDCKDCERICSGGFNHSPMQPHPNRNLSCIQITVEKNLEIDNLPLHKLDSIKRHGKRSGVGEDNDDDEVEEVEEQPDGILLNRLRSESIDSYPEQQRLGNKKHSSMSLSSCGSVSGNTSHESDYPTWMRSPELLALQHNLTFPESATASPVTVRRAHTCRRFSVDLGQMRSLRLFFADPACTSGQLVVASRESQYKILHFHHGGLDRLAATLHQWHQLLYPHLEEAADNTEATLPYRHFMVCRPEVARDELHPEEGQVSMVTSLVWKDLLNERGLIEDDLALRKGIFFGGLEPALRKIVWPFLLHCYAYQSTYEERDKIDALKKQEYKEIERRRCSMNAEHAEHFWRNVVCIVEKDVVRTDRANPYYAGEDNPNIQIMKNILLNYAVYNPNLGYTQGMSDLLAPLLAELNSEIDAFWCFAGLMQRSVAVCTPTDTDMDRNLCYLRELIKLMVPNFYSHLEKHADALELLFCHRWILLCLKREFPTDTALVMWEACWVNYLTDYFHLFLCLAIMCVYADDVIAQDLRTDEMLLHFSSLAMYMDGNVILRKARGLLHQFRQLHRLPCTLAGLCRQCGPGMWDSSHNPVIECVGHEDITCPFLEKYQDLKY